MDLLVYLLFTQDAKQKFPVEYLKNTIFFNDMKTTFLFLHFEAKIK